MNWQVIVLLLAATVLATAGALAALARQQNAIGEGGTRRAIVGLGLLAGAAALAAVGGAVLGAGGTPLVQIGALACAAATVALPLLVVGLASRARDSHRSRRSPLSG